MLKHLECLVVDKNTGEIIHDVKRTCQCEVRQDFEEFLHVLAEGFGRLIKESSDNLIILSSEDYKKPEDQFIFDVYK